LGFVDGWVGGRGREEVGDDGMGKGEGRRTAQTSIVAVNSALAVEVLLSLLGDLVDVGVLVLGRHGDVCICSRISVF